MQKYKKLIKIQKNFEIKNKKYIFASIRDISEKPKTKVMDKKIEELLKEESKIWNEFFEEDEARNDRFDEFDEIKEEALQDLIEEKMYWM